MAIPPRKILLATDLSGRCDRALDRASSLAATWNAALVVVHALEWDRAKTDFKTQPSWRQNPDKRYQIAERQIREDLRDRIAAVELVIEEGDPTDLVLQVAAQKNCDLIVTGIARSETFGRLFLGATVEHLARAAVAPVLIVKRRAHAPYGKIVVASDFSGGSLQALRFAATAFPQAPLKMLHGYHPIRGGAFDSESADKAGFQMATGECAQFLATAGLSDETRARMEILIEPGDIPSLVDAYAADKGFDLLVVGSQGKGAVGRLLVGSTSETLLSSSPTDVLLVRSPKSA